MASESARRTTCRRRPSRPRWANPPMVTTSRAPRLLVVSVTVVDALGITCPLPLTDLALALEQIAVGDDLLLLADDPGARVDVPVWCRMHGQEFLGAQAAERGWGFRVRRRR